MAEKSETLVTKEEKVAEAKELFGRGSRNYCMKQYSEAADDLSACCTIYSELYGPTADECGSVYLLYAKSLIALGKDENNLIVPGEGEEEEDDGDEEGEDGEEGDEEGDGEDDGEGKVPEGEKEDKSDNNSEETAEAEKVENKESKIDDTAAAESSSKMEEEPQPGPSTSNGEQQQNEETEEDEEEKCEGNLEVAWEILELAVKIFEGQGESSLDNLSECYAELASISLENGNFALAISDYNKALAVYDKTGKSDRRVIAEIHYKIGLCHLMQNEYDDSIKAFREACSEMDNVVLQEKAKEQDDKTEAAIKNLEETKQEVMEKIAEVEDTKKTSIEVVKRELSKIIVKCDSTNGFDGAGPSSSSSATNGTSSSAKSTEKPTDITHLIKRKKPDSATTEIEGSPAKKTAVEADKSSD
ncbi:protein NASP homolog [Ochlerotatus camptorhynchus]|uniref:protein NASP homolog n=1 Tax=Ochlerotatus camptorhynchus TaxID=644619 RepID=UPI0031CF0F24